MRIISYLKAWMFILCCADDLPLGIAEVFSSVSRLKTLPQLERDLLQRFEQFFQTEPQHSTVTISHLKGKIQSLKMHNSKSMQNPALIECPLHALRLVRRLVKQWSIFLKPVFNISTDISARYLRFLNSTKEWLHLGNRWPTDEDLSGAAMALVRLHHVYDLSYTDLLTGNFLRKASYPLTSGELSDITEAIATLRLDCDAAKLKSALENVSVRSWNRDDLAVNRQLQQRLSNLITESNLPRCQHRSTSLDLSSDSPRSKRPLEQKQRIAEAHNHLCRRTMQTNIVYGTGTRCYMQSTSIPYLLYKAELVNSEPLLVIFHDVINDEEIMEIKKLAFPRFSTSRLSVQQVAHERPMVRVSETAWLFDTSPVLAHASHRVQVITGHSTRLLSESTHAEPFQVVNYGIGGMNGLHEDSVRVPRARGQESASVLQNSGDRAATWMYYLSDVTLGGATVFPYLGAGVRPQKGSAVFWYNVKRSGQGDVRMVHAGCPVLHGDKWVANKWLREIGSTFTRPCLLDPNM